jgi:polyisoprenoid-binding protein YceI
MNELDARRRPRVLAPIAGALMVVGLSSALDAAPLAAPPSAWLQAGPALDLDELQRFEVISSSSRVGFDAESTLHDFSGATSDVSGWVEARLSDPAAGGRGRVVVRAATLRTGIDRRDAEMRERLDVERHPELRFDWTGFELEHLERATATLRGHALGTLTIRGVGRAVRVPVQVEVDPERQLRLTAELALKMSDFGVDPPRLLFVRVKDEVKVRVSLRLRRAP